MSWTFGWVSFFSNSHHMAHPLLFFLGGKTSRREAVNILSKVILFPNAVWSKKNSFFQTGNSGSSGLCWKKTLAMGGKYGGRRTIHTEETSSVEWAKLCFFSLHRGMILSGSSYKRGIIRNQAFWRILVNQPVMYYCQSQKCLSVPNFHSPFAVAKRWRNPMNSIWNL